MHGLRAELRGIQAVAFDLDGVLYQANAPIPGAARTGSGGVASPPRCQRVFLCAKPCTGGLRGRPPRRRATRRRCHRRPRGAAKPTGTCHDGGT